MNEEQLRLARLIRSEDEHRDIRFVAGVDVCYSRPISPCVAVASLVIIDLSDQSQVYSDYIIAESGSDYNPGYLGFRECPLFERLISRTTDAFAIVLVDGNGILHERGCGSASQLGVSLDIPTIGVAKNFYRIDGLPTRDELHDRFKENLDLTRLELGGIGVALTRLDGGSRKPIYVSVGHRVSLSSAEQIVRECWSNTKVPLVIRLADKLGRGVLKSLGAEISPLLPSSTPSTDWSLLGAGARHEVLVHKHWVDWVIRREKIAGLNSKDACDEKLAFFNTVVAPMFAGFICPQTRYTIDGSVHVVCTRNLLGRNTVELKPKMALRDTVRDRFIARQSLDSSSGVFDPPELFSGDLARIRTALGCAREARKKYFKILSKSDEETDFVEVTAHALSSSCGKRLLDQLERMHAFGSFDLAQIAQKIPVESSEFARVSPLMEMSVEEFREIGVRLSSGEQIEAALALNGSRHTSQPEWPWTSR
jgi:deoxyinosine 3'endonuclease (endonuclease V)